MKGTIGHGYFQGRGRMKNLIKAVYDKIINLDFPDVSAYSQDYEGILAFEEDLLEGEV